MLAPTPVGDNRNPRKDSMMRTVLLGALMAFFLALIPFGVGMMLYFDQPAWLLLSAAALIFFYAG